MVWKEASDLNETDEEGKRGGKKERKTSGFVKHELSRLFSLTAAVFSSLADMLYNIRRTLLSFEYVLNYRPYCQLNADLI